MASEAADQCLGGLNFETLRPRDEILDDYCQIIGDAFQPKVYFERVKRHILFLDCSKKRLNLSLSYRLRDIRAFLRIVVRLGFIAPYRRHFWSTLLSCIFKNPKAARYCLGTMALYGHFGPFSQHVVAIHRSRQVDAKGVGYRAGKASLRTISARQSSGVVGL